MNKGIEFVQKYSPHHVAKGCSNLALNVIKTKILGKAVIKDTSDDGYYCITSVQNCKQQKVLSDLDI